MNPTRRSAVLLATAALGAATLAATPADGLGTGARQGRGGSEPPGTVALEPVVALDGPRGLDVRGHRVLVTETDGSFSMVRLRGGDVSVTRLGSVPGGLAPAAVIGRRGSVWVLTGKGEGPGMATLYRWRPGWPAPRPVADIAAYQRAHPDPEDLEGDPGDSNPFGLAALEDGSVLVADAGGNEVLRVDKRGRIRSVARLRPRTVAVPDGLPPTAPDGSPLPPAGTELPSEGVATSVAVDDDGDVYIGELRGFPGTPGTAQVWKVDEDARGAVCDPARPRRGECRRVADGLTSVVDLAVDDDHGDELYAATLSDLGWLAVELGLPGAEQGSIHRIVRRHGRTRVEAVVDDGAVLPGGVEVDDDVLWETGPVFGPGALNRAWLGEESEEDDRHDGRSRR